MNMSSRARSVVAFENKHLFRTQEEVSALDSRAGRVGLAYCKG